MKFFGHLTTIITHRRNVIKNAAKCGILRQGLLHDLSKYSPTEFWEGVKYFQGNRSPNEAERAEKGYSAAWMHHKGRNRHHFEYWTDYSPITKKMSPVKMPMRYLKEMFCDRVAATKVYQKKSYRGVAPLEYFLNGRAKYAMHPETADLLEKWLRMLAEEGEKKTFAHIKRTKDY